jgi:hypothetical protein
MTYSFNTKNILLNYLIGILVIIGLGVFPSLAQASGETAQVALKMQPQGPLYSNAYSPINWGISTNILTADPQVLPMKKANLSLPPGSTTFNPRNNMPVCPDDKVGPPPTNMSVSVEVVVARCPNSVLGNGTAKFALAQSNALQLDGLIVVFNGGRENGLPKLKVYAYSYDTGAGIYTSAVLQKNGALNFDIPILTADSSVTKLSLEIPGKRKVLEDWGAGEVRVVLPAGQDRSYVRARCTGGAWPFSASFDLGTRDAFGEPTSPTTIVGASDNLTCSGANARPKISRVTVNGPKKAKRNKATTYTIKIRNSGAVTAKSVWLRINGRGVKFNRKIGVIGANQTRVVRVRVKFRKPGKIRTQFKVTSGNAGSKVIKRFIRVNR